MYSIHTQLVERIGWSALISEAYIELVHELELRPSYVLRLKLQSEDVPSAR